MAMSPRLLRPRASGQFLLNNFSGASAAYSLRRLSRGYTQAAIRVRRSNDNNEANFTPAEIANGTMAAWVGANNGFVVTWFDQSGNGRNAVQATSGAQPIIVNSGALSTLNGLPSLSFDGNRFMATSHSFALTPQPNTSSVVGNITGGSFPHIYDFTLGRQTVFGLSITLFAGNSGSTVISFATQKSVVSTFNGTSSRARANGVSGTVNAGINSFSGNLRIGAFSSQASGFMIGNIQEVILWPVSQESFDASIASDVMRHYGIT